jgi:eukaryotic-like serine/threonine-protein kinase
MFCPRCHRTPESASRWFCPYDGAELVTGRRARHIPVERGPETGKVLAGRYSMHGLLAQGGMARVYLAEDKTNGEAVAVKILDRVKTRNSDVRARFFREVEIARMLEHPSILRIFDAGELAGHTPYLVTELLFGESLGELLRRTPTVEPGLGIRLVREAASGLAAAHRMSVVHRDIKPDNLFLLGEPGKPYALKVMDFGLAKLHDASLTTHGMTVGTLSYMPPEQSLTDPVDARSDVYALGVVMFRMFTGQLPFGMSDDMVVLGHHVFVPPPRPSQLYPGISRWLEKMILVALRKNPENRYPSMDALIEDLDRISGLLTGEVGSVPLRGGVDVYEPRGEFARDVADGLKKRLLERNHDG